MWIFLVTGLVLAVIVAVVFNTLIRKRILTQEAWSGIDVQLKRRHDLIPNLVEVVKGYMKYESGVLERVTELRSQAANTTAIKEKAALENDITQAIKKIFALVEAYPDLKASQQFLQLQTNLTAVEDEIQLSRRYYNGTVRDYNIAAETFPNNIIAGAFGFQKQEFFELETATDRAVPVAKF